MQHPGVLYVFGKNAGLPFSVEVQMRYERSLDYQKSNLPCFLSSICSVWFSLTLVKMECPISGYDVLFPGRNRKSKIRRNVRRSKKRR